MLQHGGSSGRAADGVTGQWLPPHGRHHARTHARRRLLARAEPLRQGQLHQVS